MPRTHEDKEPRWTIYNDWLLDGAIFQDLPKNPVTLTYMSIASRRKKAMMRLIVKMQQPGLSGGGSSARMWIRQIGGRGQPAITAWHVCVCYGEAKVRENEGMACSYSIE